MPEIYYLYKCLIISCLFLFIYDGVFQNEKVVFHFGGF